MTLVISTARENESWIFDRIAKLSSFITANVTICNNKAIVEISTLSVKEAKEVLQALCS